MKNLIRILMLLLAASPSSSTQTDTVHLHPHWMRSLNKTIFPMNGTQVRETSANESVEPESGREDQKAYYYYHHLQHHHHHHHHNKANEQNTTVLRISATSDRGGKQVIQTSSIAISAYSSVAITGGSNVFSTATTTSTTRLSFESVALDTSLIKIPPAATIATGPSSLVTPMAVSPPEGLDTTLTGILTSTTNGTESSKVDTFTDYKVVESTSTTSIATVLGPVVNGTGVISTHGACNCACLCGADSFELPNNTGLPVIVGQTNTITTMRTVSTSTPASQASSVEAVEPVTTPPFPLTTIPTSSSPTTSAILVTTTPLIITTSDSSILGLGRLSSIESSSTTSVGISIETSSLHSKLVLGNLSAVPTTRS